MICMLFLLYGSSECNCELWCGYTPVFLPNDVTNTLPNTRNNQVLSLTEFTGIDANGQQTERQQTYSQSTTTATQNWRWDEEPTGGDFAFLVVEMVIGKFEYTSFEVCT